MTVTRRAYSFLTIKAVNEEKRIITGIATTPAVDRVGDIVEPLGVKFNNPMPFLWQHNASKPIGTVKFEKPTKDGIKFEAELPTVAEDGTLKDRIEEAWQSIKLGLVRAVSIGFRAIEYSFIEGTNGIRFLETEVYELSAVTIPANEQAIITGKSMDAAAAAVIKQFDTNAPAATGEIERPANSPGASGKSHKPVNLRPKEGTEMKTLAEQITALEAKRAANTARMEEIQSAASEAGRTKDQAEKEEFSTLADENDTIDDELKDLRRMERSKAVEAKPVNKVEKSEDGTVARVPAQVKVDEKLEKGIEFARYAMCMIKAKGDADRALMFATKHYPNSDRIVKTLRFQAEGGDLTSVMKATIEAGTTTDPTWAAPLVDYQNFAGDFVEFLRPRTIIGQFGTGSIPSLNRIPFNVRIAGQTSGGNAYWVGEGAPKPLTKFDFNATELRWAKVATIAVLTKELIRFSDPSAERLVRDGLAAAVIERIDIDFIDPAKAPVADVSPGSITNGITAIVSSGNTADDIRTDVQALWATFIAARNPPRQAVYIMDSTTALALSLLQNPLGQSEFPGLTMNGGTFLGVPAIVSDYVPSSSAGSMVVLANASDVWLADDGQVTIDASQEASLQMLDNPTNNSATGTPTTMVSMFQTNSVAFRAERYINWARRRNSGVAVLTGVNWGAPSASG